MAKHVLRLSRRGVSAIADGHPWVFREGPERFEPGTVLRLDGPDGRRVAWGLADDGPVAVRVLGRGESESIERLLMDRVARADRARTMLLPPETNAYRLIHGAGDGLPGLVADRYLTEVLDGLDEGERVVVSGQFLLDSESQLREAVQKLRAERLEAHQPGAPSPAGSPPAGDGGDDYWTCPMHPQIVQDGPGSCPICGMDLVEKKR